MHKYKFLLQVAFFALLGLFFIYIFVRWDKATEVSWAQKDAEYQQKVTRRPTDVMEALYVYRVMGFKIDKNSDYLNYPPDSYDITHSFPLSKGFFLMFNTEKSCGGKFSNNKISLYSWTDEGWKISQSLSLEDVDFQLKSDIYDFQVEGTTVRLYYSHDTTCWEQSYWVELP
ncbi:hypothetical protein A2572_01760 [Candidatus Collierbacteria bacterium RIFOXYD1_FULL_40_9]|uniref:Uncharacterized protein n=1 Tax=Candidatus Collierbacteria bacterium RIFOXYD1_FULL_40_9 TaxID=1817731 RepID=A0A1F5FUE3_9BACT|nr:MAG: hypothetical protein A2572_01760 [Candidatus Collierbacteria bacterium RIFOXYD1_FULL_40_9]